MFIHPKIFRSIQLMNLEVHFLLFLHIKFLKVWVLHVNRLISVIAIAYENSSHLFLIVL